MNDKKSAYLISGMIMLALIGVLCIFSVRSVKKGGPLLMTSAQGELRNTIEIPLEQAKDVSIAYTSDNLKIYPTDGNKVIIKEYLSSKRENALATVEISDGKATVTGGEREIVAFWLWISVNERIEIYLPKEGLNNIKLVASSGNISAKDGAVEATGKVEITAKSGNIRMEQFCAEEMVVEAKSGNIHGKKLQAKTMCLETKSGNISAEEISGQAAISASSGNVTIETFSGAGSIDAGSGNVKVEAKEVCGDLSLQAGSGNVKLVLPAELSFEAEIKTGSGNIRTDYDDVIRYEGKNHNHALGTVGKTPVGKIFLKTGSGNVSLREQE